MALHYVFERIMQPEEEASLVSKKKMHYALGWMIVRLLFHRSRVIVAGSA